MNTIFGASSMFNNQPPAANRQFREDVARLLPCGVHATARNRARPIPFPSRMGPPPHAFRFSAVSPLRGPQRGQQLVRAATSVAANYAEATDAESREDFVHKMKVALKELKESRVRLMFASRLPGSPDTARLLSDSRELTLIFGKSVNTASQGRG